MKLYKMSILFACLLLSSCTSPSIKDNEIVVVEGSSKVQSSINAASNKLNVDGINKFVSVNYEKIPKKYENCAVITVSPDGSYAFLEEKTDVGNTDTTMLIGQALPQINLIRLNLKTLEATVLCKNISFINEAKWNSKGTVVGFCGGEEIKIYDNEKNRFMFENETDNDSVTYFGWSPEGDKIFTEHPNIINGNIYYLDLNKVVYAYEARENIYYRGILNEEYYYGTSMVTSGSLVYSMVIVNSNGNVVYKGDSGRFRDSYENQMAYIGASGAGLYYYPDVNDMTVKQTLSNNFVHDVKFVYGGNIAYIDSNSELDKNNYVLHIVSPSGKETSSMEVSGSVFSLSPDGAYGWIGGASWEKIDFRKNSMVDSLPTQTNGYSYEDRKVFSTIRSAIDIWQRINNLRDVKQSEIEEFFTNTNEPQQSAMLDMENKYSEIKDSIIQADIQLYTELYLKSYKKYTSNGYERATAYVYGTYINTAGIETSIDQCMELIKVDGKWYVTGFSTFPMEQQTKDIRAIVENYVKQIKEGVLIEEMLKDAEIEIGQLQFWSKDGDRMATDITTSGYCKAYLTATQNGVAKIYKLVLKKDADGTWKVSQLTDKSISTLF
jgi:hypothetical protein